MLTTMLTTAVSLLLLAASTTSIADPEPGRTKGKKEGGTWTPPEFDESLASSVTVMEGDTVALPCVVTKLRGRSVSWIRQRDLHVISANQLIFTSDDRFKVRMDNLTSSFTLEVRTALTNDSGVYECQVNTRPKLSRPITLTVQAGTTREARHGIEQPRPSLRHHTVSPPSPHSLPSVTTQPHLRHHTASPPSPHSYSRTHNHSISPHADWIRLARI